jgi:superfamily II DNA or RNA helicase
MQLREHQTKAIDMIRSSFKAGNKRVLLAACCSFGKTHTAAYMLKPHRTPANALCSSVIELN